ncbi:MAG: fumarylacetoacetate hydrolase family protein, partial [Proteobacteria bacterium]|nr:fumarylacetoacetate hydrolase family protein [Pseudomonadota bacterium]
MSTLNETHDPALKSWVESANHEGGDFPIQNLPFGVFRRRGFSEAWRGGVAIGDQILDMRAAHAAGVITTDAAAAAGEASLNRLMGMGPAAWSALRLALSRALRRGAAQADALRACLVPQSEAEYTVPARIGDYADFYTSIHHATNIGRQFRPDNPLLPNYKWIPIGYHGRSSSITVSGQDFHRPRGQTMPPGATDPGFEPSITMDTEMEVSVFMGTGNALGHPIP